MIESIIAGKIERHGPDAPLAVLSPRAYGVAALHHQEDEPRLYADEPTYAAIVARQEAWRALGMAYRERARLRVELDAARQVSRPGPAEGGAA